MESQVPISQNPTMGADEVPFSVDGGAFESVPFSADQVTFDYADPFTVIEQSHAAP